MTLFLSPNVPAGLSLAPGSSVSNLFPRVEEYGGVANAADNTAAVAAAYAVNDIVYFSKGTWKFSGVALGSTTLGAGRRLGMIGAGENATIIQDNGSGNTFSVTGPLDSSGDSFFARQLTFKATSDLAYTSPLLKLTRIRDFDIDRTVRFEMSGTGTALLLDTSYRGTIGATFAVGRYGVPFEIVSVSKPLEQMDTYLLDPCRVSGSFGPIVRNSTGGIHAVTGFIKVVSSSPDFGNFSESTLLSSTLVADTACVVQAGLGGSFDIGDPILIGAGATLEVNKITGISTDTLSLAQPLRFAHSANEQIIAHGFSFSSSTNNQGFSLRVHFEGPGPGWIVDGGADHHTLDGSRSAVRYFIWDASHTSDMVIGGTEMGGSGGVNAALHLNTAAVADSSNARIQLRGPFPVVSGAPALTMIDPSTALDSRAYEKRDVASGIPYQQFNAPTGNDASSRVVLSLGGAEKFKQTFDGSMTFQTNRVWKVGSGSPEGVVTSSIGGLYTRTDGGALTTLYVKESGTGNTGWVAK